MSNRPEPEQGQTSPDFFTTTHWSLVGLAGRGSGDARRQALAELLRRYLPALRSHLVDRRRIDPHRADDLLQGFLVSKVLEQDLIGRADRSRGRFRSFLLTALHHYVANEIEKERAQKRSPGGAVIGSDRPWDVADPSAAPDEDFDAAWASEVLAEAVERMRRHCERCGRLDLWEVFRGRVLGPALEGTEPEPYGALAERLGWASPTQGSNVLVTANRTFTRVLRAVIGEYEPTANDIDAELADLRKTLSRGARPG